MQQKDVGTSSATETEEKKAENLIASWKGRLDDNLTVCREAGYLSSEKQTEITAFVQLKLTTQEYAALLLESPENPLLELKKLHKYISIS